MSGLQENQGCLFVPSVTAHIGIEKRCTKCGLSKPLDCFRKNKHYKSGYGSWCRSCTAKASKQTRDQDIDQYNKRRAEKRRENQKTEAIKVIIVKEKKCNTCGEVKDLEWFGWDRRNSDNRQGRCRKCDSRLSKPVRKKSRLKCAGARKEYNREWRKKNPEKLKKMSARGVVNQKSKGGLSYVINNRMHSSLSRSLRRIKSGRKWESLVGYTLGDLITHVIGLFNEGMTIDNYGEWHIDHIIPKSAFNYETPDDIDFKRCWSLSNLCPLWAIENQRKYNKVNKPFQPSLLLEVSSGKTKREM